ncbi:hypothetical protein J2W15_004085 [Pseudarthrobacter sulfonivorans]|jgi:hypothetical protein|nr:hypothetical protein [Pseudarthrobacter sulfonivorans]
MTVLEYVSGLSIILGSLVGAMGFVVGVMHFRRSH